MSRYEIQNRRGAWRYLVTLTTVIATLLTMATVSALAHDIGDVTWETDGPDTSPEFLEGNVSCGSESDFPEFKIEDMTTGTYTANSSGVVISGETSDLSLQDVVVHLNVHGQTFDYEIHGGVAEEVVVKGGPNANLFDYNNAPGATPGAQTADDGLHAPNRTGNTFYGLSHISFCINPQVFINATLSGAKTNAVTGLGLENWTINIFEDVNGTTSAPGAPVSTDLDGNWSYTTEDILEGDTLTLYVCEELQSGWEQTSPSSGDADTVDILGHGTCHVVTVNAGDQDITIPGLNFANTPLGALEIVKTAKHADSSTATSANLEVDVLVEGPDGFSQTVTTDATTGVVCIDGLQPGTYTVTEQDPPTGYAIEDGTDSVELSSTTPTSCTGGDALQASISNVPLTDISWTVDSQHDGATSTLVQCWDDEGTLVYNQSVSDGTASFSDLLPTDPTVTLRCDFTVDP